MSIRLTVRMAAPSILISLLLLTMGGVGGWYVQSMQRNTAKTVSLDMATIQAVEQLVFAISETRMELAEFLATGDRAHLQAVPAACEQIERSLAETEKLVDDDDEIALAGRIRAGYEGFLAEWRKIPPDLPIDKTRQAVARLNDDLAANSLLAPAKELLALEERLTRRAATRIKTWRTGLPSACGCWGSAGRWPDSSPASGSPAASATPS